MQPLPKRPVGSLHEEEAPPRAVRQSTGAPEAPPPPSPLSALHSDLLGLIFSFLHPEPRLFVVPLVCQRWRRAVLGIALCNRLRKLAPWMQLA